MKQLNQTLVVAMLCVFGVAFLNAQQTQNQAQQGQTALPAPSLSAQQNLPPQPAQPAHTQPCAQQPSEFDKHVHITSWPWFKSTLTRLNKSIDKATKGTISGPTPDDLKMPPAQKPCPAPAPAPAAQPTAQTQNK